MSKRERQRDCDSLQPGRKIGKEDRERGGWCCLQVERVLSEYQRAENQ